MDKDFENFTRLVRAMRDAQKTYFRTRTGDALKEAKRLEAEVDRALKPAKDDRQEELPL